MGEIKIFMGIHMLQGGLVYAGGIEIAAKGEIKTFLGVPVLRGGLVLAKGKIARILLVLAPLRPLSSTPFRKFFREKVVSARP